MGKMWEKGKAELAAYGRFGLQDAQRLVMGEWHGGTQSQPGMAGTITPAEADRQLNDDKEAVGVQPPDEPAKEPEPQPEVQQPEPEPQEPDEPEMG